MKSANDDQSANTNQSGACVEYLVQQYDKNNKISFDKAPEKFLALSWVHFQMSGEHSTVAYLMGTISLCNGSNPQNAFSIVG